MTKEALQERLTKLEQEKLQLAATLNAYEGAIAEAKHWLTQLDTPKEETV